MSDRGVQQITALNQLFDVLLAALNIFVDTPRQLCQRRMSRKQSRVNLNRALKCFARIVKRSSKLIELPKIKWESSILRKIVLALLELRNRFLPLLKTHVRTNDPEHYLRILLPQRLIGCKKVQRFFIHLRALVLFGQRAQRIRSRRIDLERFGKHRDRFFTSQTRLMNHAHKMMCFTTFRIRSRTRKLAD